MNIGKIAAILKSAFGFVSAERDAVTGGISFGPLDADLKYLPRFGKAPLILTVLGNSVAAAAPGLYSRIVGGSKGAFLPGVNAGVGGNKTADMLARINADVPANTQVCLILEGTNDANAWGNSLLTVEQHCANMRAIIGNLRSRGIMPVVILGAPWSGYPEAALRMRSADLAIALECGCPVYDPFAAIIDQTTGGYAAGYTSDNTHPTQSGHAAAFAEFMAQLSGNRQASFAPLCNNAYGVFRNCLMLTGSNADGLADYWSKSGSATCTLSSASGDGFRGNWQNISATTGFQYIQSETRSLPVVSDGATSRIQINVALKYTNTSNSVMQCYIDWLAADGSTSVGTQYIAQYVTQSLEAQRFSLAAQAPAGAAKARLNLTLNTATSGAYNAAAAVAEFQMLRMQSLVTT